MIDIFQQHGLEGLHQLPGIGDSLARTKPMIGLSSITTAGRKSGSVR